MIGGKIKRERTNPQSEPDCDGGADDRGLESSRGPHARLIRTAGPAGVIHLEVSNRETHHFVTYTPAIPTAPQRPHECKTKSDPK